MAEQAINAGATKEEITETIRSAQYIRGVGCVYAAARTFKVLFVPGTFDLTDTVKVSRIITTQVLTPTCSSELMITNGKSG